MAVETAALLTAAAVPLSGVLAVTAVSGDTIVIQIGAAFASIMTLVGVVVATRRKRTEPASPSRAPDVVTIRRSRYDELVRAEERDRMHREEQAALRELREDR